MVELSAEGLVKSYRLGATEVPVLRGVDLRVAPAERVVICGVSGSGKTTLLNVLGGLDRADAGRVCWNGKPLPGGGGLARWRGRQVGFIFQAYHLLRELTVMENVLLPAKLQRWDRRKEARRLLEEVGLGHRLEHRADELSGGEQQRAVIARALVNDPAVILADEPTGNLDTQNSEAVVNLLLDLTSEKKKALVLVTHNPEIAGRFPERRHLVDGRFTGPVPGHSWKNT